MFGGCRRAQPQAVPASLNIQNTVVIRKIAEIITPLSTLIGQTVLHPSHSDRSSPPAEPPATNLRSKQRHFYLWSKTALSLTPSCRTGVRNSVSCPVCPLYPLDSKYHKKYYQFPITKEIKIYSQGELQNS